MLHGRRRREPGDAGVQGSPVLSDGGGVVAVEDLALRPLGSPVAGGAIGRKDRLTSRQRRRITLRLVQRPHGGEDPQGLRVEGVTAPVRDTVVVDRGVRQRRVSLGETLPGVEIIAGEAAASLGGAGVGVEVGVAAAHGAPVEDALIIRVLFGEHPVQRNRLARPGAEDPGYAIGQPVRMARPAAAPGVFRHLALEIPRDEIADRGAEDVIVRDAEGGEEGELAHQDGVLEAARGRGLGGVDVEL